MPIRFRCPHCNRLLGIATRKAGTEIACPQCGIQVTVPRPAGGGQPDAKVLDEIDEILGLDPGVPAPEPAAPVATPPRPRAEPNRPAAAVAPAPKPPPPKPAPPPPPAKRKHPADSLFETDDVDALLGLPSKLPTVREDPAPAPRRGEPKPVTGMDVQSLDPGNGTWIVSPQKAALIIAAIALLLLVAFGGGFLIASLL